MTEVPTQLFEYGVLGIVLGLMFWLFVRFTDKHGEERKEWREDQKKLHERWIEDQKSLIEKTDKTASETNTVIRELTVLIAAQKKPHIES